MIIKYKHTSLLIILFVTLFLLIAAKSCASRNNTKTGSSNPSTFTINTPSGLSATLISYSRIDLSWTDTSNNEDGFEVERSVSPDAGYSLIATIEPNITSYSDTSIYPNNTYYYRIRAFNTIGDKSNYSNIAYITSGGIISVSAGAEHCLCINSDGTVWAWGRNDAYQVGIGNTTDNEILWPTRIQVDFYYTLQLFDNVKSVTSAYSHSLALRTDGTLWSWGANGYGQLGDGTTDTLSAPVPIGSSSDWEEVEASFSYSIAKKTNGTLWSWGDNQYSQLGLGDNNQRLTPTRIGSATDWEIFSSRGYSTIAIGTNDWGPTFRCLWAWGGFSYANEPSPINFNTDWNNLSSGDMHYLARKNNGSIWSWGWNQSGQLGLGDTGNRSTVSPIGSDSDWAIVTAGLYHSFSIKNNGTLWSWGGNANRQLGLGDTLNRLTPTQVGIDSDWSIVSGGNNHSIGLKQNGTVLTWGSNVFGQLGYGDTNEKEFMISPIFGTPSAPSALTANLVSQSQINLSWLDNAENESGFAIERKTGRGGDYIQIGTAQANVTYYSDLQVLPLTTYYYRVRTYNNIAYSLYSNETSMITSDKWSIIGAGSGHSIAGKTNGTIWSWGWNHFGQLGLNDTNNRNTPTQIGSDSDWTTIVSKGQHSVARKTNGSIWSWGFNTNGQLGLGDTIRRTTPTLIGTDFDWINIATGNSHTIALKTNPSGGMTLWAWGFNDMGQLGLGVSTPITVTNPIQIGSNTNWSSIISGNNHNIAFKTNGSIWGWGYNNYYQLGLGDTVNKIIPTQIGSETNWSQITASNYHTIALKNNGTIWGWGRNVESQLGLGESAPIIISSPTQIGSDSDWSIITTGGAHTLAVKTDKTIWVLGGSNIFGQLGLGYADYITLTSVTQMGTDSDCLNLISGSTYNIMLKNNGTIWLWGDNQFGQLGLNDIINRYTPSFIGE